MNLVRRWSERGRRARRLRRAEELIADGDLRAALTELKTVMHEDPSDRNTERRIIELHAELGDTDEVVSRLPSYLRAGPAGVAFLQSAIFDGMREDPGFREVYASVIQQLEEQVERDPDETDLRFLLAQSYEEMGAAEEAHTIYVRLMEYPDEEVRAQAAYADARLSATLGDASAAAAALRRAVEISASTLDVMGTDAAFDEIRDTEAFREVRQFALDRRIEALREAVADSHSNPSPARELVDLLLAHGQTQDALSVASEAMERFPGDLALHEQYANALFALDRREEAMEAYQDILRLKANHAWALYRTGVLYHRQGNAQAARGAYWDALDALRDEADIAYLIARGFARLNHPNDALTALERASAFSQQVGLVSPAGLVARMESEEDFTPLRDLTEFRRILEDLRSASIVLGPEDTDE